MCAANRMRPNPPWSGFRTTPPPGRPEKTARQHLTSPTAGAHAPQQEGARQGKRQLPAYNPPLECYLGFGRAASTPTG